MLKLRFKETKLVTNLEVSKEYAVKPEALKDNDKIPITVDDMFRTIFQNQKRIKYSCKLISYYIVVTYEMLLQKLRFTKNQPGKENNDQVNERCDYVAQINDTNICIEMNNNSSPEIMERNIDYIVKQYSESATKIDNKVGYKYNQVILFNLNNFSYVGYDDTEDYYTLSNGNLTLTDKIIVINIYIPNIIKKLYNSGIGSLSEREKYIIGLVLQDSDKALEMGKDIDIMEEYVNEAISVSHNQGLRESYDKQLALLEETKKDGYKEGYKVAQEELTEKQKETLEEARKDGYNEGYKIAQEELTEKQKETLEEAKKDGYKEGYKIAQEELTEKQKETLEEARKDGYNEGYKIAQEELTQKTIDIARNLLNKKIDINIIADATGLTIEEINNLTTK